MVNVWESVEVNTKRRVNRETKYDYYWLKDYQGKYGFSVGISTEGTKEHASVNLKGIDIVDKSDDGITWIILILLDQGDWEIFKNLCNDLISALELVKESQNLYDSLVARLKRWQSLLKGDNSKKLSLEKQMGLFAELLCLETIISRKMDMDCAIDIWCGPEGDKQDFILDDMAIEVKSHITSKGNLVRISSADQLITSKDKLYLVSYSITNYPSGEGISDLHGRISEKLSAENLYKFDFKLIGAGWIPGCSDMHEYRFVVDDVQIYKVNQDFPKIIPAYIDMRIQNVKYSIDMSLCGEWEIDLSEIIGGE